MLGKGGYGAAYLVIGTEESGFNHNKTLVAKINFSADRGAMALLETGILRQIDHPNVVKTVDQFLSENGPISILELCVYGSLFMQLVALVELKKEVSAFPEKLIVKILHDLCSGLHECHRHGIVHLDIKTDNCLIDAKMSIKLADFGIAMFVDEDGQQSDDPIRGTKGWRAPETLNGILTKASDIFGLGAVMYCVCTIVQRKNKTPPYATVFFQKG